MITPNIAGRNLSSVSDFCMFCKQRNWFLLFWFNFSRAFVRQRVLEDKRHCLTIEQRKTWLIALTDRDCIYQLQSKKQECSMSVIKDSDSVSSRFLSLNTICMYWCPPFLFVSLWSNWSLGNWHKYTDSLDLPLLWITISWPTTRCLCDFLMSDSGLNC